MHHRINFVLFFALLAVSTSSIFARFLPNVPAVVISFWRLTVAGIILWIYTFFKQQSPLARTDYKYYILSGLFLALHFTSFYQAVKLTSIANATLLGVTAPMFTIIFERFILKRQVKPLIFLGFVFALCGTMVIAGSGYILKDGSLIGKIYGLLAALCIATVYILANKLRNNASTLVYTKSLYTIGAMFLLFIALGGSHNVLAVKSSDVSWLLALGAIPTILGHSLFYYSIKHTSPTIVASVPLGEPIIASILALIIFSEQVSLITLFGGTLILCGVYIIILYSPRSHQADKT